MEKSHNRKNIFIYTFGVILILAAGYYLFFLNNINNNRAEKSHKGKPISVAVAVAKISDVNVSIKALGTVTPRATINVKTFVDGQITKLYFHEGENVHANQKLAHIDSRQYEVSLEQAQGQMAKDKALLDNANTDLLRYENLRKQNSVSIQVYDTQKALVHQYEASLKVDQAAIKNAKLQLSYCTILAPISGRVGLRLVDEGNIIHTSDQNGIVTITSMQPITALFTIPQKNIQQLIEKFHSKEKVLVDAYNQEDSQKIQTGYLISTDNQIDPSTGTLKLRAEFNNKDLTLFPNQFINIHLLTQSLHNVVTVPQISIQNSPQGSFVYVVGKDKKAHIRKIKSNFTQDSQAVIVSGISAGEKVVIDGIDKLKDGVKVIPSEPGTFFSNKHKHGFKKEQE
jgi:membrane fusion protein, multidrug efflux system